MSNKGKKIVIISTILNPEVLDLVDFDVLLQPISGSHISKQDRQRARATIYQKGTAKLAKKLRSQNLSNARKSPSSEQGRRHAGATIYQKSTAKLAKKLRGQNLITTSLTSTSKRGRARPAVPRQATITLSGSLYDHLHALAREHNERLDELVGQTLEVAVLNLVTPELALVDPNEPWPNPKRR